MTVLMKTLPDIGFLADAREEELLKLWEGLGYYNRVRNLNKAARWSWRSLEAECPSEYEDLIAFRELGAITAGAIGSIAYGKVVPAVDGNVLRVLARLRADGRDIMQQGVQAD